MENEEKDLHNWFAANGFRVQLQIGAMDAHPEVPDDKRPDHTEKYARVERKTEPGKVFRRYKMNANDTTIDSFRRVKELLESELKSGEIS